MGICWRNYHLAFGVYIAPLSVDHYAAKPLFEMGRNSSDGARLPRIIERLCAKRCASILFEVWLCYTNLRLYLSIAIHRLQQAPGRSHP